MKKDYLKKPIPKNKLRLFKFIAVSFPIVLIILFEIFLTLIGYGYKNDLFIADKENAFYYRVNPEISKKYFLIQENATIGNTTPFLKEKTDNTFRIFVLGASTAVGFPYLHNAAFPRILKYRLSNSYPDINFEVVNLSLTAVNSYTLYDFSKQLINYAPDAILIYAGQNEYYGALGVASTSNLGSNINLVRLTVFLKKFRTIQLIHNILRKLSADKPNNKADLSRTLMERMTADAEIKYNSEEFHAGLKQYQKNMEDLLEVFNEAQVPVFLGTLFVNEKDLKPFNSSLADKTNEKEWQNNFSNGENLFKQNLYDSSKYYFEIANKIDSSYALTHYYLGKIYYQKENYERAKTYFINARQLDGLRFRAPLEINHIIKNLKEKFKNNVTLVDIEQKFRQASKNEIIGNELLLEHVHPNLYGNFLMANTYFESIENENIIQSSSIPYSSDQLQREMPILPLDSLKGTYEIAILKEQWPFNEKVKVNLPENRTYEEKLAGALAVKQIKWAEALQSLYKYSIENEDFEKALKINEALALEYPYDPRFYNRAAKIAMNLNLHDKAIFNLKKAYFIQPNIQTAKDLFITYLKIDEPSKAMPYINFVMENDKSGKIFKQLKQTVQEIIILKQAFVNNSKNINVINQISTNYLMIGNYEAAEKYVDMALKMDSSNSVALNLLNKIQS